jgi:hypothetical protein
VTRRSRGDEPFAAALRRLHEAHRDAVAAVTTTPDAQEAFKRATELADMLRDAAEAAADLRARAVARIADEQSLSLAVLAERIGVSKARAGQLVQTARKTRPAHNSPA